MIIGDSYGGGIVFYLNEENHIGLIAMPSDLDAEVWSDGLFETTGANLDGPGAGKANTGKIVQATGNTGTYAAKACLNLTYGGFDDWYLPSKNEVELLYLQKDLLGFNTGLYFWSSTEVDTEKAWAVNPSFGGSFESFKYSSQKIRAIRSFYYSEDVTDTALDVIDILYRAISNSTVGEMISGGIYKYMRPLNSIKEDIVINSISYVKGQMNDGVFNVNIHVPNLKLGKNPVDESQPNTGRIKALVKDITPFLTDITGDGYNFSIENDFGVFTEEKQSYNNLRIKFNAINI